MKTKDYIAVTLAVCVTLSAMIAHGWYRNRWGIDATTQELGQVLHNMPETFGDWELKAKKQQADDVLAQLECKSYIDYVYYNRKLDATVEVVVFLGAAGPLAVHTPDVCYRHSDYKIVDTLKLEVEDDRLNLVVMESRSIDQTRLHVCYGWRHGDHWEVSDNARFEYSFRPRLYKLQMAVSHPTMDISDQKEENADGEDTSLTMNFLRGFLPALDAHAMHLDE